MLVPKHVTKNHANEKQVIGGLIIIYHQLCCLHICWESLAFHLTGKLHCHWILVLEKSLDKNIIRTIIWWAVIFFH
jgi:hypothetical protein